MRRHSDALLDVLSGSFARDLTVNVFHGAVRVQEGLRLESWSLSGDLDNEVTCTGAGVIVYESVKGESLLPEGTKGVLSPFRATLELVMRVTAGDFEESVSLGLFMVTRVPNAHDFTVDSFGRTVVVATRVAVEFRSLEERVRRWGFRSPQHPQSTSCFDELRRITGMPVRETVDDAVLPSTVLYEAKKGGRLAAVQLIGDTLGGVPVVDSSGAWVIIPDELGDPVGTLRLGSLGTVTDVGYEVDTDEVFNVIVGQFEADDEARTELWVDAEVPFGDLSPSSPFGENTLYITDDRVTTQAGAEARVAAALELYTSSQQYDVPIQCHINPLAELGDVLTLTGWTRPLTGRAVRFSMSESELMTISLRISRVL